MKSDGKGFQLTVIVGWSPFFLKKNNEKEGIFA